MEREFAKYVNVFMVRGIFTKLHYSFGYFASQGLTGDQMYPCCLEATRVLETIEFQVLTVLLIFIDTFIPNKPSIQYSNPFILLHLKYGITIYIYIFNRILNIYKVSFVF